VVALAAPDRVTRHVMVGFSDSAFLGETFLFASKASCSPIELNVKLSSSSRKRLRDHRLRVDLVKRALRPTLFALRLECSTPRLLLRRFSFPRSSGLRGEKAGDLPFQQPNNVLSIPRK
jgi:hypothetical protein